MASFDRLRLRRCITRRQVQLSQRAVLDVLVCVLERFLGLGCCGRLHCFVLGLVVEGWDDNLGGLLLLLVKGMLFQNNLFGLSDEFVGEGFLGRRP